MTPVIKQFIGSFSNSIGYFESPQISTSHAEVEIQFWVWLLFFAFEFMLIVILLNFLIAEISKSYDIVLANQERLLY